MTSVRTDHRSRFVLKLGIFLSVAFLVACERQTEGSVLPASNPRDVAGTHHKIGTKIDAAQVLFDQGLAFVYAFDFIAAERAFRRAAELDPTAAMPYWGIALAVGPNYNSPTPSPIQHAAGLEAVTAAVSLASAAPDSDKAYIGALANIFSPANPSPSTSAERYSQAMRQVYRQYPDDPDAGVLFACSLMNKHPWNLWINGGEPGLDTGEILSVLESVLRMSPWHIGANHFYIHAMEASPYPERALPSAQRLGQLGLAVSHLIHMPSHIYMRTGDLDASLAANVRAISAERQYPHLHDTHASTSNIMHYQRFIIAAANMAGDYRMATETAAKMVETIQVHMSDRHISYADKLLVQLRFARWQELIESQEPDPGDVEVRFLWHLGLGSAYAAIGDIRRAKEQQAALMSEASRLPTGPAFGMFNNDWRALGQMAVGSIRARIATAIGDLNSAVMEWQQVVAAQDELHYDDVPDWYYPVRESLAATLLRAHQYAKAEQVLREELRRTPRNPRAAFCLARVLELQKDQYDAHFADAVFHAAWKGIEAPRLDAY